MGIPSSFLTPILMMSRNVLLHTCYSYLFVIYLMLDWWVGESLTVCKILYTLNQTGAAVLLKVIIPMRRAHALLAKSKVRLFCTFSCLFLAHVVNLFCTTHPLLLPHYFHDSLFRDTVLQTELIEAQTSSEREPWNFFTEWVGSISSKNLNHTPAQLFYFMGKVLHERATCMNAQLTISVILLIVLKMNIVIVKYCSPPAMRKHGSTNEF